MDCQEIQRKLGAFLDGELNPEEGKIISDHLDSCPACQAEWEALSKLDNLVAENQGLDPGEEAWQRMRDGIGRAITPGKARHRAGIMNWLSWLLSPRYAVVKVGTVVAVAVMAFVVSRHITMEQITPPTRTISEHTISRRDVREKEEAAVSEEPPAPIAQHLEETKQKTPEITSESEPIAPKPTTSAEKHQELLPETVGVDTDKKAKRLALESRATDGEARVEMETVEDVRDVLANLPGIHVDEEGEFHFRGGRSSEVSDVTPRDSKKTQMDISINETQEEKTLSSALSSGAGTSRDRMTFQTESSRNIGSESDPPLAAPFSQLSYWEEYQVSITADQAFPTQADSLWHEYRRCEGKSCLLEVIPYLTDVLFRQALQDRNQEIFDNIKPLMETYRERLEDTWGEPRYRVRWEKLLELTDQ